MIVECPLIIIHETTITTCRIKHLCQTQHVIGVARLRSLLAREHRGEVVGRMKMLAHAVTADGDGAPVGHGLPEETCRIVPTLVTVDVGNALETDDLGYLRIGVHAGQPGPRGSAAGRADAGVKSGVPAPDISCRPLSLRRRQKSR